MLNGQSWRKLAGRTSATTELTSTNAMIESAPPWQLAKKPMGVSIPQRRSRPGTALGRY